MERERCAGKRQGEAEAAEKECSEAGGWRGGCLRRPIRAAVPLPYLSFPAVARQQSHNSHSIECSLPVPAQPIALCCTAQ